MSSIAQKIHVDPTLQLLAEELAVQYKDHELIILVDEHTREHCLPILQALSEGLRKAPTIHIPAGEKHKNQDQLFYILLQLTQHQATRKTLLINLGGGVICDIGAFAASIYKRGIPFMHVPTSLLAQIDASIGGKNGIDFQGYKNLLGTIRFPEGVFISTQFLKTLPSHELKSGLAEAFKHALISDRNFWNQIKDHPLENLGLILERSISIKQGMVEADPYEKNIRKKLNAGHTIGHAIESWKLSQNNPVTHGEAVAAGLLMESFISNQLGYLANNEWLDIEQTFQAHFHKIDLNGLNKKDLLSLMQQDKKNTGQEISFSLIRAIGEASINDTCSIELIEKAIDYYIEQ